MKPATLLGILFGVLVLGGIVFSTFHQQRIQCRVCVTFNGKQDCRVASAASRQEAQRTAVSNACAQISSGVDESIRCENTPPDSVTWMQ